MVTTTEFDLSATQETNKLELSNSVEPGAFKLSEDSGDLAATPDSIEDHPVCVPDFVASPE